MDHSAGASPDAEAAAQERDPGYASVLSFLLYGLSLPERTLRTASSVVGGTLRESAQLLVPQAFRSSKTYNVMVQQMLDFMAEDIGGVETAGEAGSSTQVDNYVARKAVGNFIDMAGLATLHLSPLMLLAIVGDLAYGSHAYLQELGEELKRQGVIAEDSTVDHVDDLLEAVGEAAQATATVFDTPPLSLEGLKQTVHQTRSAINSIDPASIIPQAEVARLWDEIHQTAAREGVNPFAVSSAMTIYSLEKIGTLGRGALSTVKAAGTLFDRHVIDHYVEALEQIRSEGIYASLSRTAKPYIDAVWKNFSSSRSTITEDVLSGRMVSQAWGLVRRWFGGGQAQSAAKPAE